ncbi:hypothetical protein LSCM4_03437 [Leishmania orientalis]|uniref:Transmembrane protein n=1 Tax=Leishmania orientalis TaxID=2249476 RepID=A0A836KEK7_9TRYP|nr:hypothetical protein LSCM4_03437 [Leishmania orientalis]
MRTLRGGWVHGTRVGGTALRHAYRLSSSFSSAAACSSSPSTMEKVCSNAPKTRDPFLRDGTATSRFLRAYRAQLPFPARMFGIFLIGFILGLVLEVFACKTHLYESVMMKKDARRHEFDEFVVDFRQRVERWQREDMSQRHSS